MPGVHEQLSEETGHEKTQREVVEYLRGGYTLVEKDIPEEHEFADGAKKRMYKNVLVQAEKQKIFYTEEPLSESSNSN